MVYFLCWCFVMVEIVLFDECLFVVVILFMSL